MQRTLSWPSPPTAVPTHGRARHPTRLTSRTRVMPVTSRVAPHRPYKGLTPCSSPSRGRRATLASWLCHPSFLSRTPWPAPPFLRTSCTSRCLHHSAGAHPGDSRSSPSSPSLNAHCDDSFQLREQTTSLAFPAVGCPVPASSFLPRRRTHPLRIPACRARLRAPSCHRRLDPHDDPHDGEGVACAVPCPVVYTQLRVAFRIISSAPG